jgi:hypothetical protein
LAINFAASKINDAEEDHENHENFDFIIPRFVVVAAFFDETATSSAVRIKPFCHFVWLAPVSLFNS